MARAGPRVDGGVLLLQGDADAIVVGTPEWLAWLDAATVFRFAGENGSFTARKERGGRTGHYWRAYIAQGGELRRMYLGRSRDLTLDRLNAAAQTLGLAATQMASSAGRAPRTTSSAVDSPGVAGGAIPSLTTHLLVTKLYIPQPPPNVSFGTSLQGLHALHLVCDAW